MTASRVRSSEVPSSKKTASIVPFSELKALYKSVGRISIGTLRSAAEVYQMTEFTPGTSSICFLASSTWVSGVSSKTMSEKAPLPNSFFSSSWPFIVSIVLGR